MSNDLTGNRVLTQVNEKVEVPYWESMMSECLWGRYMTAIEAGFIAKASGLAGKPTTAFEVGAEGGRWSRILAERGWKMTCTDIREEALKLCKQRIPDATCILVKETDETLPAETASVPLLLCVEVPYVIERDWFMTEATRVTAKGGYFVGVMNNRTSPRGFFYNLMLRLKKRAGYPFYQVSYPEWRQKLRDQGFEMVAEEGYCWFPVRRNSSSPLIPFITNLEKCIGLRKLARFSPWIVFIARKVK